MEAGSLFIYRTLLFIAGTLLSLDSSNIFDRVPCMEALCNTKWNSAVCPPLLGLFWAFHSLLPQDTSYSPISGVMSFALCPVVVSQASQHFSLTVEVDCLKRSQSDHMCHHSHRFSEFATESGMGSSDWNLSMVEISCGYTAPDMSEWR